eukprot:GILJ01004104.1.p1 GENE.GILJ01004104.1~~GILJ01004104.1.p1  ORF type:complete len:532 (+),score=69.97 GILJ01004104.1:48-1598(+)
MSSVQRKVCLICIDGWGLSTEDNGNAILHANTPVMDGFQKNQLWAALDASGLAVGLPEGVMGNSEVGHLTIGAGQREFQDLVKINLSITKGTIFQNEALNDAFNKAKTGSGRLHFLGLLSDGGVHSHINHLLVFLKAAKDAGVPKTFVQVFTDGRDTDPKSGVGYLRTLQNHMNELAYGSIATVSGRYYAMDRDKRWERVQVGYEGFVGGKGQASTAATLLDTVNARYAAGETDEFLKPIVLDAEGLVKDGDTLVFFDFRADRMREIVEVMGSEFLKGDRHFESEVPHPRQLNIYQMTQYNSAFPFPVLFPPQKLTNGLSEWLSKKHLPQFHTAETEKYAHVTFFFNGGREAEFPLEDRRLVESPKGVPTYDLAPSMNAQGVADSVVDALRQNKYPFVMCNFAPPDMVGHTGNYDATLVAVETTDRCIGQIWEACEANGYVLVITADHGNAELMIDASGKPVTSHSTNPVPLVVAGGQGARLLKTEGGLEDVAPTVLTIMGLDIPSEMTGSSLVAF